MSTTLLVQPDDGALPVLTAIRKARKSIDTYLFKLSHPEVIDALSDAVSRGVSVRALVTHENSEGSKSLRKLESALLKIGASVSRSDDDLLRYHGKMMIVDCRTLYVLGYNFTRKDIEDSRSLGIFTRAADLVAEAITLFEADFERRTYTPTLDTLLVSPLNSRSCLLELIAGAKKRLLIYDPRLSDTLMQKAIERRALAGVAVRVIGNVEANLEGVEVERSPAERLHVRAIVQDDRRVFIGSQSLRRTALERRREIGVILDEKKIVAGVVAIFERDWAGGDGAGKRQGRALKIAVA